jgi:hypothetical protein
MVKQETWYVWDSRGGLRARSENIQLVNFDLEKNLASWRRLQRHRKGISITGSIASGRMTYKDGLITCEFWREDKPNPTPYTVCDNPDPIREQDGDERTWISK